jgi:hypothetical protein
LQGTEETIGGNIAGVQTSGLIKFTERDKNMKLHWLIIFSSLLLLLSSGCQEALTWAGANLYQTQTKEPELKTGMQLILDGLDASPRIRVGYLPTPTLLTVFSGPNDLGQHGYCPNLSERNGIVYTCKAGAIDVGHARKAADWTLFLAAKTYKQIMKNETEFSFRLYEPSRYYVTVTYPDNWKDLSRPEKERIAYELSVGIGRYLAFTAVTWHEVITWFGFKSKGLEPEYPSAFTWEETFSNLFGTHVAAMAIEDSEHTYNEAVTLAFDRELRLLDVQSAAVSRHASESVKGPWFTGDFYWIAMKKRNFDLGFDDGLVTPTLIPSVSVCEGAQAQSFPVPGLDFVREYGFSVRFEIKPNIWEGNKILDIAYPDGHRGKKRVEPAIHYPLIMAHIRKEAIERYGFD